MKAKDLRKKTKAKLEERLKKVKAEVADLKFGVMVGEEQDYSQIKKKRKEVARIETILEEGTFAKEEAKKTKSKK